MKKSQPVKVRSAVAQAAWAHNGAGAHRDSRREGRATRGAAKRRAIHDSRD